MAEKNDFVRVEGDTAIITLSRPFKTDAGELKTLTMREPTVADSIAADEAKGSALQKEVRYFANLCQLSPDDIQRLPFKDYQRMQAAFEVFTG